MVVLARHELNSSRGAQRLRVRVGEPHAIAGQLIQCSRFVRDSAVARQAFDTNVVRHNQNDVGPRIVGG